MTTIREFREARDASAKVEKNVRTEFAHCRGFRAGAEWASKRIAERLETMHKADRLTPEEEAEAAVRYARSNERLAASTEV